jgi:hypothetical protein
VPGRFDLPVVASFVGDCLPARQSGLALGILAAAAAPGVVVYAEPAGSRVYEEPIARQASPAGADLAADDVRVGADVLHQVLPDVELHGRVAVDPLAHFGIDLVPLAADVRPQKASKRGKVFIQVLLAGSKLPGPLHRLSALPILRRHPVRLTDRAARELDPPAASRAFDDHFSHVLAQGTSRERRLCRSLVFHSSNFHGHSTPRGIRTPITWIWNPRLCRLS